MNEFYQQYFCPYDEKYSVIIEDNGRVSYAYLLKLKNVIGDVWLYNKKENPDKVNWKCINEMPFLNPKEYIDFEKKISPIVESSDVHLSWKYSDDLEEVNIFIKNGLIAILKPQSCPGWSYFVKKDGPLAKKIEL